MVQEHAGFEEIRDDQYIPPNGNGRQKIISILSQSIFLEGFTPPEYLVEGVLQRGFIYSLTGRTGHAKTAIALMLARAVGCEDPTAKFGGQLCEKGRVLYLVGENADDIRARLIAAMRCAPIIQSATEFISFPASSRLLTCAPVSRLRPTNSAVSTSF